MHSVFKLITETTETQTKQCYVPIMYEFPTQTMQFADNNVFSTASAYRKIWWWCCYYFLDSLLHYCHSTEKKSLVTLRHLMALLHTTAAKRTAAMASGKPGGICICTCHGNHSDLCKLLTCDKPYEQQIPSDFTPKQKLWLDKRTSILYSIHKIIQDPIWRGAAVYPV